MIAHVCEHCAGSLEGKRSDARYCSDKCRMARHYAERRSTACNGFCAATVSGTSTRPGRVRYVRPRVT
jgi:hypothetical protein